jgi:hypothetical protein
MNWSKPDQEEGLMSFRRSNGQGAKNDFAYELKYPSSRSDE